MEKELNERLIKTEKYIERFARTGKGANMVKKWFVRVE